MLSHEAVLLRIQSYAHYYGGSIEHQTHANTDRQENKTKFTLKHLDKPIYRNLQRIMKVLAWLKYNNTETWLQAAHNNEKKSYDSRTFHADDVTNNDPMCPV